MLNFSLFGSTEIGSPINAQPKHMKFSSYRRCKWVREWDALHPMNIDRHTHTHTQLGESGNISHPLKLLLEIEANSWKRKWHNQWTLDICISIDSDNQLHTLIRWEIWNWSNDDAQCGAWIFVLMWNHSVYK